MNSNIRFEDKIVAITGASSGIGSPNKLRCTAKRCIPNYKKYLI